MAIVLQLQKKRGLEFHAADPAAMLKLAARIRAEETARGPSRARWNWLRLASFLEVEALNRLMETSA